MGRSGFNGVPGPPGEKGQSISPPNELKFKVPYYKFNSRSFIYDTNFVEKYFYILVVCLRSNS